MSGNAANQAQSRASSSFLAIVGSGGLARETLELVCAAGGWTVVGIFDDRPDRHGAIVGSATVVGGVARVAELEEQVQVVLCTGSTRDYASRRRLVETLGLPPHRYATLVHPATAVASSVTIGAGTVVLAGVVMTADVRIGSHVVVMPATVFTHDDVIEDYVTIAAGARLAGGVRVAQGAYIGSGALVREGVTVGAGALVGMGAVVLEDVPPGEVWAGVPARALPGR